MTFLFPALLIRKGGKPPGKTQREHAESESDNKTYACIELGIDTCCLEPKEKHTDKDRDAGIQLPTENNRDLIAQDIAQYSPADTGQHACHDNHNRRVFELQGDVAADQREGNLDLVNFSDSFDL